MLRTAVILVIFFGTLFGTLVLGYVDRQVAKTTVLDVLIELHQGGYR